MSSLTPKSLTWSELVAALHAGAMNAGENAAISLLAAHGPWLAGPLHPYIEVIGSPAVVALPTFARVRWTYITRDLRSFRASEPERAVLEIALSIACDHRIDLGLQLRLLGPDLAMHVAVSVVIAAGGQLGDPRPEVMRT